MEFKAFKTEGATVLKKESNYMEIGDSSILPFESYLRFHVTCVI